MTAHSFKFNINIQAMTTITSTFIGIAFPHSVEFVICNDNEEYCYMQLYEVYLG